MAFMHSTCVRPPKAIISVRVYVFTYCMCKHIIYILYILRVCNFVPPHVTVCTCIWWTFCVQPGRFWTLTQSQSLKIWFPVPSRPRWMVSSSRKSLALSGILVRDSCESSSAASQFHHVCSHVTCFRGSRWRTILPRYNFYWNLGCLDILVLQAVA